MFKPCLALLFLSAVITAEAAPLTALETRWLTAGAPVLAYAKQQQLPIDIIVQPQAGPNDVPMAMGFDQGRCKLVLSLRGNPDAEAVLAQVPAEQQALLIEVMTAHEVGHCWRYAQGSWHALPAGFVEATKDAADNPSLQALSKELRETRREEGFSDLVALAWTRRQHAADYAAVYTWLAALRQPMAHGSHNTQAWLALASNTSVFDSEHSPFEQARALWSKGLLLDE
jgi:hypothetical protein